MRSHSDPALDTAVIASFSRLGSGEPAADWRSRMPCKYFQRGYCWRANSCLFAHGNENGLLKSNNSSSETREMLQLNMTESENKAPASVSEKKAICRYFHSGSCIFGSNCLYRHVKDGSVAPGAAYEPPENQLKNGDFVRTIGNSLVQFDAGAVISKISLPSDFSAARISGLRSGTTKESIQCLLTEEGFDIKPDNIRIHKIQGDCAATIKSDDPMFSKNLCSKIEAGYPWRGDTISVTPIATPMPSGHNSQRVDCKKVHISWHKAVRVVQVSYGGFDDAQMASQMFSSGEYLVLGQKIIASQPIRSHIFSPWSRARSHKVWVVTLTDVPAATESRDIMQACCHRTTKVPYRVKIGPPTYLTDIADAADTIRLLMSSIGPLEYWGVNSESHARRVKATARFMDEADARRAETELNNTELPFHSKAILTVQAVYSAKFKVSCNIYDAVQPEISAQQGAWENISFKAYPSADVYQRFRTLKVEGESAENVASAKKNLQSILSGVVAKDTNGKALWSSSMEANGKLCQGIRKLEEGMSIIVSRDKVKCELTLFGGRTSREKAQKQLAQMVATEALTVSTYGIELQPDKLIWACNGGFREIVNRLGAQKAIFDIDSKPARILIISGLEDYNIAKAMVEGPASFEELSKKSRRSHTPGQACAVCWTEAENPIKTKCGHIYCSECFQLCCMAENTAASNFAILCHGDQGNCKKVISIEDLVEHLSSSALEDVLERAFSSYITRHHKEFRHCPTADCGNIYRVTTTPRTQHCSNCLIPTCTVCHASHVGMSCADWKEIESGAYEAFQKLKTELGIKDCPECKTPLEKLTGCDHMICKACGAHLCWVCLKVFPAAEHCYQHIGTAHGNWMDDELYQLLP